MEPTLEDWLNGKVSISPADLKNGTAKYVTTAEKQQAMDNVAWRVAREDLASGKFEPHLLSKDSPLANALEKFYQAGLLQQVGTVKNQYQPEPEREM